VGPAPHATATAKRLDNLASANAPPDALARLVWMPVGLVQNSNHATFIALTCPRTFIQ
jgi:hypothetical protein